MASTIHGVTWSSRRLTTLGWKSYAVASLALLAAASVIFVFSAPSPVTARLSFTGSDGNSSEHDISISPTNLSMSSPSPAPTYMLEHSRGNLDIPPLQELPYVPTTVLSPGNLTLSPSPQLSIKSKISISPSNLSTGSPSPAPTYMLEHSGGNLDILPLQELPYVPTTVLSPGNLTLSPSPQLSIKSKSTTSFVFNDKLSSSRSSEAPPSQFKEHITLTETDRDLVYAKMEITNAPPISHDPDLHAPLFKNVSVFKRSYELMEKILKVYIYRDGRRPIFHTPVLQGIYASEGWFLKLMEANTKFVVKDPNKAHLFYLPYNSRQLQAYVYKPNSHDLKPLAVYLKDHIEWISSRYPFWNRTKGADHFLVACHDWGPYTTRLHPELNKNTIKALCNADLTEGFVKGKDVSLPETYVRNPRKLQNDLGGKRVSKRSILAFFAGKMHGRVRPVLLDHWLGKDETMKIYGTIPPKIAKKMSYAQHMKSSKFCICPMGYEVNSPRIVEAIHYECVPVIIADNFVLPFDEVLDWSAFSIVVAEIDIANLKNILLGVSRRKYFAMHENVRMLKKHFLWHLSPEKYDIFHMILHSVWYNRLNQVQLGQ